MRTDARDTVARLGAYFQAQSARLTAGMPWDPDVRSINDLFHPDGLEVFKNEIYPRMGIGGICYSLDLGAQGSRRDLSSWKPTLVILDRYLVHPTDHPRGFHVMENGSLKVFVDDGLMHLDLSEGPVPNVHDG